MAKTLKIKGLMRLGVKIKNGCGRWSDSYSIAKAQQRKSHNYPLCHKVGKKDIEKARQKERQTPFAVMHRKKILHF